MSALVQSLGKLLGGKMAAQQVVDTSTRSVARERLSVILASQRGSEVLQGVDMEVFQQDIMKVVKKHIDIAKEDRPVNFQLNSEGQVSFFEMSVELEARRRSPVAE